MGFDEILHSHLLPKGKNEFIKGKIPMTPFPILLQFSFFLRCILLFNKIANVCIIYNV